MIQVLTKNVADKIAAGEVIDRPVSIVKELVENSIDAKADQIVIEIKDGGKSYIRVTDNGIGIPREECETAFLRHATSKITKASDLDSIESLGFRGEALASIAAVTHTTMITKCREDEAGTRVVIHGGEVIENSKIGCPDGTSMIITDLFYNTPARRQFLHTGGVEAGHIIRLIQDLAIAYPDIQFRMIHGGEILFASTGDGDRKNAILAVYQQKEYRGLIPIHFSTPGYELSGCISRPSLSRTTRRDQIFFVNGRVVKSRVLEKGVSRGYRERLFPNRFPVVFLFLTTDPSTIDVNIHPTKREVRFHDENAVILFMETAIEKALSSEDAIVRADDYYQQKRPSRFTEKREEIQTDIKSYLEKKREAEQTHSSFISDVSRNSHSYRNNQEKSDAAKPIEIELPSKSAASPIRREQSFDIHEPVLKPFDIRALTIKGSIFDTYILCEDGDNFYMIDQHAAHERVFYEQLVGQYLADEKLTQPLLLPLTVDLPLHAAELSEEWLTELRDMGYDLSSFGPNLLRVEGIPTFMTQQEAQDFIHDFIDQALDSGNTQNQVVIDKLITRSCKSAVKAHDHLSEKEMQALLDQLTECRNPFSCPHGRPTFIRFTKYEIEKFFKRIQS